MPALPEDWTPDELESARIYIDVLRFFRKQGDKIIVAHMMGSRKGYIDKEFRFVGYAETIQPRPADETDPDIRLPPVDFEETPTPAETTATDDAILEVLAKADKPIKRMTIARRIDAHPTYVAERLKLLRGSGKIVYLSDHTYWLKLRGTPPASEASRT